MKIRSFLSTHLPILLIFAGIGVLITFPMQELDTFWHAANGRYMLETGRIVNEEIFSHTAHGTPFVNHWWLAQIIIFSSYALAGVPGLVALKVLLGLTTFFVLFKTARKLGVEPLLAALLCLLVAFAGLSRFTERPELFSLLGLALLGYLLLRYKAEQIGAKTLVWIPVIIVLWEFLHGSVMGILYLGAFVLAEVFKPFLSERWQGLSGLTPLPAHRLRPLLIVAAISFVAMLVNPYRAISFDLVKVFVQYSSGAKFSVDEFLPTPMDGYLAFWVLLIGCAFLLISCGRRSELTHWAIFIPFAYLAVRHSRFVGAFAVVMLPIVALHLQGLLDSLARRIEPRRIQVLLLVVMVSSLGYVGYFKFYQPTHFLSFGYQLNESRFPVGATRFIQGVGLAGNMYNPTGFGGYLSFFAASERPIFKYNIPAIFHEAWDYSHNNGSRQQWNINYAVTTPTRAEMLMFPPEEWAAVFLEPTAIVMVRRVEQNRDIIARYELRFFQPRIARDQFRALSANPGALPRLAQETSDYLFFKNDKYIAFLFSEMLTSAPLPDAQKYSLVSAALRQNQDIAPLLAIQGYLLYQQKQLVEAREKFNAALTLNPDLQMVSLNLAYLELDAANFPVALDRFNSLLEKNPEYAEAIYGLGLVQFKSNDMFGAADSFEKYLGLVPTGPYADRARSYLAEMER